MEADGEGPPDQMKTPSPGQILDGRASKRSAVNESSSTSPDNSEASKRVDRLLEYSPSNQDAQVGIRL